MKDTMDTLDWIASQAGDDDPRLLVRLGSASHSTGPRQLTEKNLSEQESELSLIKR